MDLETNNRVSRQKNEWIKIGVKCIIFAIIGCSVSMLAHMINSAFIEKVHGKPEFVTMTLFAFSFITKILIAIGYMVLGYKIIIKNSILRAFTYVMLIWLSNFIPQIMGLAGADGPIAANAFSISTVVCDSIGYPIEGLVLGMLFRNIPLQKIRRCLKEVYIKGIIISAVGFPLLVIIVEQIIGKIYAPFGSAVALGVSQEKQMSFYITFYSWFILTGALLAVFYRITEYNEESTKGWLKFGLKYAVLLWSPIVLIMIVFGTEVIPTIAYTTIFIICIMIISWLNEKVLEKGSVVNRDIK